MLTPALERVLGPHGPSFKPALLAAEPSPAPTAIAPLLDALSAGRVDLRKAGGTSLRDYLQCAWR